MKPVNIFYTYYYLTSSSEETELSNTAYDILNVLSKDADFIYDTIETYIQDAQKANKPKVIEIWQTAHAYAQRSMSKKYG